MRQLLHQTESSTVDAPKKYSSQFSNVNIISRDCKGSAEVYDLMVRFNALQILLLAYWYQAKGRDSFFRITLMHYHCLITKLLQRRKRGGCCSDNQAHFSITLLLHKAILLYITSTSSLRELT